MHSDRKNPQVGASVAAASSIQPPAAAPHALSAPSAPHIGAADARGAPLFEAGAAADAQNGPHGNALPPLRASPIVAAVHNGDPLADAGAYSAPPLIWGATAYALLGPNGYFAPPPAAFRASSSPLAAAQVIPIFTGDYATENVERFLLTLRSVAQIENWAPNLIREILVFKTDGSANSFVQSMNPDALVSLEAIEIAFRNRFKQKWSLDALEQDLYALRQEPQETVELFYGRVTDLLSRLVESTPVPPALAAAQVLAMLDDRLLRAFITGLRCSLMRTVRSQRPSNLEQAKAAAIFEEESENLAIRLPFSPSEATIAALYTQDDDTQGQRVSRTQQPSAKRKREARHGNSANAYGAHVDGAPTPAQSKAAALTCFECGERGHIANMCPERICGRCMASGHRPKFCPSLYPSVSVPENVDLEGQ
jgi:Zinc knuckle/Retrotransposon gag protein